SRRSRPANPGALTHVRFGPKADIGGTSAWALLLFIGESPTPYSEPKRIFTSSQPAIADEIVRIERRCFAASLPGSRSRSDFERRADACIYVAISEACFNAANVGSPVQ